MVAWRAWLQCRRPGWNPGRRREGNQLEHPHRDASLHPPPVCHGSSWRQAPKSRKRRVPLSKGRGRIRICHLRSSDREGREESCHRCQPDSSVQMRRECSQKSRYHNRGGGYRWGPWRLQKTSFRDRRVRGQIQHPASRRAQGHTHGIEGEGSHSQIRF